MNKTNKTVSKSNLYGRLLLFVFFVLLTVIITSEFEFVLGDKEYGPRAGGLLFSIFYTGVVISTVPVLKNLGYSAKTLQFVRVFAFLTFIITLIIANPFLSILPEPSKPYVFAMCHGVMIGFQVFFARVILIDIFKSKETHSDHIWGAIVVYYLLIMVFADTFEIISLFSEGVLGKEYLMGFPNFIQIIMFSTNMITGMDPIYPNAHPLFMKLGTLENMMGNLFLIVILGRLLSNPMQRPQT